MRLAGTLILRDGHGRIVRRCANTSTDAYVAGFAPLMAGLPAGHPLALTHIGIGASGIWVERCESVTGWTGAPVLDTTTFREGSASFRREVTAGAAASLVSPALSLNLSAATHIEAWLRVNTRARLAAGSECLRLTTSVGNHLAITWGDIETLRGSALVDGTWTRVVIPVAAFTATGSPSWGSITSVTLTVTATADGPLTAHWDGILALAPVDVSPAATAVPNETSRLPFSHRENLAGGRVRVRVSWGTRQVVGTQRVLGLYADAILAAIVRLEPPLEKSSLLSLTVEWTVTMAGG